MDLSFAGRCSLSFHHYKYRCAFENNWNSIIRKQYFIMTLAELLKFSSISYLHDSKAVSAADYKFAIASDPTSDCGEATWKSCICENKPYLPSLLSESITFDVTGHPGPL